MFNIFRNDGTLTRNVWPDFYQYRMPIGIYAVTYGLYVDRIGVEYKF